MEEKLLLAELKKNCKEKMQKLNELIAVLDLTELGRDVQRQHFKDIENRVLNEHEFFADKEYNYRGESIKAGDRITDERYSFMLSEKEFDRLQNLMLPIYVAEGLTDENFRYIKNWDMDAIHAKQDVVRYIVDEIVPKPFREIFESQIWKLTFQDKLISIFRKDAALKADREFMDYSGAGDILFWSSIAEKGRVSFIAEPLNLFRQHGSNRTVQDALSGKGLHESLMVYRRLYEKGYISRLGMIRLLSDNLYRIKYVAAFSSEEERQAAIKEWSSGPIVDLIVWGKKMKRRKK